MKAKAKAEARPNVQVDKSLMRTLTAALDRPVGGQTWRPQEIGDAIGGEILSLSQEDGKYGPQTVLVIAGPNGPTTVYANESMRRELETAGAQQGRSVVIVYRGNVKTGRGRPFRLFSVATKS